MTPELLALALAALLQFAQFTLAAIPATAELGTAVTLGTRDDGPLGPGLSPRTARLVRAFDNHFQSLTLFTIAVIVVTLAQAGSALTAVCAWLYLGCRVAYVPAYWLGLVPWRSVAFAVANFATLLMILAALAA